MTLGVSAQPSSFGLNQSYSAAADGGSGATVSSTNLTVFDAAFPSSLVAATTAL